MLDNQVNMEGLLFVAQRGRTLVYDNDYIPVCLRCVCSWVSVSNGHVERECFLKLFMRLGSRYLSDRGNLKS